MIQKYKKGTEVQLSDDFNLSHFDCQCELPECQETLVDDELVKGLQKLAERFPIINITSGYRCAAHNKSVGGAQHSYHVLGMAADIKTPFGTVDDIAEAAEEIPCFKSGAILKYPRPNGGWVHVDCRKQSLRQTR